MQYMTVKEAAEKWQLSARRIQLLCALGRIKNALHFGKAWAIPADATKPT